jgi:enediyne biosynthesis protein E4
MQEFLRFQSMKYIASYILLVTFLTFCQATKTYSQETFFEKIPYDRTGITFVNTLEEKPGNNILESEFFYNGGGIAVGDINGNGFPDLYFTANQGRNALYINQGNYRFRDITDEAGVADEDGWSAGVAFADVTGNGLLDIYICKAGKVPVQERRNKLFINNGIDPEKGIPTFTERAAEFGIDDPGYCTQPVFFDYNGDGLLDLFIVNYNTRAFRGFDIRTIRSETDPYAGDKLYRNNGNGTFTDVSREAGIMQNPIGFGLSATVSDLNGNGLPDIYVTNDFMERDYMYINQGDGTFIDEILYRTDVTSYFSMGSDIADITNNGLPDIFVADMMPPGYNRRKVFKTPDYAIYDQLAAAGYHRKNMRNTLQINKGDGVFTEMGQLAGIHKTDWTWAVLIADFDNDGNKDIFLTNGFPRFYTNLDYLNNILWRQFPDEDLPEDPELKYRLVQQMERVEMHNFAFRNEGDLRFAETTEQWGLKEYTVASAAVYVDLNLNGALDLVISNINEHPSVFRNNAYLANENNYLKIRLQGSGRNTFGIGSKVKLTTPDGQIFFQEAFYTRGFHSTVDPTLHFGLGDAAMVNIEVTWPDGSTQNLNEVAANQFVTLRQGDARHLREPSEQKETLFTLIDATALGIDFVHESSFFRDRVFSPLMPHTLSNLGPALTSADVNGDGLPDLFIGGGQGQAPALYLQQPNGTFAKANVPDFERHSGYDDIDAVFFDATGNGINDLYVVSGGNFDQMNGEAYQDRLYINDGFGNFRYRPDGLPRIHSSGATVTLLDFDGDGRIDLFVGGRVITGQYPAAPRSFLLKNNGGTFSDVTAQVGPGLMRPGMITSALWVDTDSDGQNELILAGEWMPIRVFKMIGGVYNEITDKAGFGKSAGWWNVIEVADLNGNGLPDIIAGNRGVNSMLRASPDEPAILFHGDFNNNGLNDPLITEVIEGRRVPFSNRDLFLQQLPSFSPKFPDYASWAAANAGDIVREARRSPAQYEVHTFESTVFLNRGDGTFEQKPLPRLAQTAPVFDLFVADFFGNGLPDILAVGNNFGTRPEIGPMADHGIMMKNNGGGEFIIMNPIETGFYGLGDVRKIELVSTPLGPVFILGRYGEDVTPFLFRGIGGN